MRHEHISAHADGHGDLHRSGVVLVRVLVLVGAVVVASTSVSGGHYDEQRGFAHRRRDAYRRRYATSSRARIVRIRGTRPHGSITARGECAECDAALEMVDVLGIADGSRLRGLADRVGAMLTGLIRRQQVEAGRSRWQAPAARRECDSRADG